MLLDNMRKLWDKVCKKKEQPVVRKSNKKISDFVKTENYHPADKKKQLQLRKREIKWKLYKKHNRRKNGK